MRTTIAAATIAASVAVGGLAGSVLGAPTLVGAAETATSAAGWVQEALTGLVDDGTISQEQADAVEAVLEEARPERAMHHRGFRRHLALSVVAESLGISQDELRSALGEGSTIADVAADEGVGVASVIDAIVTAVQERLDERVAAGDLTQERADELLAGAEERATALVNGELPASERGHRHGHRGFGPDSGAGIDDAPAAETSA